MLSGKFGGLPPLVAFEFGFNERADFGDAFNVQLHSPPPFGNASFDLGDQDGPLPAVLLSCSVDAVKVRVHLTPAVAGVHHAEPSMALAAEHAALQVVGMFLGLLAGLPPDLAHRLHLVEDVLLDERRVATLVFHTLEGDPSEVVAVAEHLVDVLDADRAGWPLAGRWDAQATPFQFAGEHRHRPVAAGVGLKHPLDKWRSLVVDDYGADLAALEVVAHVFVAKWRQARRAAHLCLLAHAFPGFLCQVGGVELSDGGHDAVHESATWGLVDVLRGGHQLRTGLADGQIDRDVVLTGAGKAIHFVHDDKGDIAGLSDEVQHGL